MNSEERSQERSPQPIEMSASLENQKPPIDDPWDLVEETTGKNTPIEEQPVENITTPPSPQSSEVTKEEISEQMVEFVEDAISQTSTEEVAEDDRDLPQTTQPDESEESDRDLREITQPDESSVSVRSPHEPKAQEYAVPGDVLAEVTSADTTFDDLQSESANIDIPNAEAEEVETERAATVTDLERQEQGLRREIASLETAKVKLQQELINQTQALGRIVPEALTELERRKQVVLVEVEKLERRKARIDKEMRTTFAGVSQDLAIRVQGFKNYLVGSLQDLAIAAEQLELMPDADEKDEFVIRQAEPEASKSVNPQFAKQGFQEQVKQIRRLLDQYRTTPDYYGPPWQLRRTFEPIHAERVSNWFFSQGGRGALRAMGSRLQNILVASAAVSVLSALYGGRVRVLVLANIPERLGEWRRGLQDCLGIDRRDFSPDRGVALFEDAEALAQKADRLVKDGKLPIIIIDESEEKISLSMLQFPLWLAFAPEIMSPNSLDRF